MYLEHDVVCPYKLNLRISEEVLSETFVQVLPHFNHFHYAHTTLGDIFLSQLVAAIETGDPQNSEDY